MPKAVVTDGYSIDRHIPLYLRDAFYKSPYPEYTYVTTNGYGPYDFSTQGLVLYLPLWALKGSAFKSVDDYKHTCSVQGALWTTNGRSFDNIDEKITIPDAPSLQISGDMSFIAWVNQTGVRSAGYERTILTKRDAGGINYVSQLSATTNYMSWSDGVAGFTGTQALTTATWYHIATTVSDGTLNGVIHYIDLAAEVTAGTPTVTVDDAPLDIGTMYLDDRYGWYGLIGEIWLYNRVLSLAELTINRNATAWRY